MNWLGLTSALFAFPVFVWGCRCARTNLPPTKTILAWGVGVLLTIPGALYIAYYARLFGEPIWFYQLRAAPGSELLAFPAGFLAGLLHVRIVPRLRLSRWGARLIVPLLLGFGVALPYLKPLVKPQPIHVFREQWSDGVCLQSTYSTCGPASAATIMHHLGLTVSEKELAVAAHTSASGTENWYLARALRRRGMLVSFVFSKQIDGPLPAIVGVKLKECNNAGHFIALLEKRDDRFIFGDPMEGRFTNTLANLAGKYEFTGFMLSIQPQPQSAHDH